MLKRLAKTIKSNLILILILSATFSLRFYRIEFPADYVFDEVYYVYTAKEYIKSNPAPWTFWIPPPEGKSYAWVNPPLPQEIIGLSMLLFNNQQAWTWRIPGILLGTLSCFLVYKIAQELFKKKSIALLSSLIFSLDGLNFVQSRVAMLDIYLTAFILSSIYFYLKNKFARAAFFLGLALACKWTAIYLLGFYILIFFGRIFSQLKLKPNFKLLLLPLKQIRLKYFVIFLVLPVAVYLLTYIPFFWHGFSPQQYISLLKEEVNYHLHLDATHDYASPWWSWPLSLYPVWYYVSYYPDNLVANIFAAGNIAVFWGGSIAVVFLLYDFFQKKLFSLFIILTGALVFWLPWALSPRIMFFYYFSPVVPFLSLALGYQLDKLNTKKDRFVFTVCIFLIILGFAAYYPYLTGIPLPKDNISLFFIMNLAKNPF